MQLHCFHLSINWAYSVCETSLVNMQADVVSSTLNVQAVVHVKFTFYVACLHLTTSLPAKKVYNNYQDRVSYNVIPTFCW